VGRARASHASPRLRSRGHAQPQDRRSDVGNPHVLASARASAASRSAWSMSRATILQPWALKDEVPDLSRVIVGLREGQSLLSGREPPVDSRVPQPDPGGWRTRLPICCMWRWPRPGVGGSPRISRNSRLQARGRRLQAIRISLNQARLAWASGPSRRAKACGLLATEFLLHRSFLSSPGPLAGEPPQVTDGMTMTVLFP